MRPIYKSGKTLIQEIHQTALPEGGVLGQAGIVIKGSKPDEVVCIDPYLTFSIENAHPGTEFIREIQPPLTPHELKTNLVLITHYHNDHMDLETISGVYRAHPHTQFAVPASHVHLLHEAEVDMSNVIAVRHQQTFSFSNVKITPVATAHTQYETDGEGNHYYLGYFIEMSGVRIFHSGDAVVTAELIEQANRFRPHISLLPINGEDFARTSRGIVGNMNFREAAIWTSRRFLEEKAPPSLKMKGLQ